MEVSCVVLKLVPFSSKASGFCFLLVLGPVGSSSAGWSPNGPSDAILFFPLSISADTNWNNNISAIQILTYCNMTSLVCVKIHQRWSGNLPAPVVEAQRSGNPRRCESYVFENVTVAHFNNAIPHANQCVHCANERLLPLPC